jgi:phosphoribosyl 1,2-cyclic phosphodiesterase
MSFKIKFWGVRGSIACPSPDHVVYGGNTSCIEVLVDGACIILDAGTGIRQLGQDFLRRGLTTAEILLTHTHWDHINGFPFFAPAYRKSYAFTIRAGHLTEQGGIGSVLASQMTHPMFPVPMSVMQADLDFRDFRAGESFRIGAGVEVATVPLRHPNGATGYRLQFGGRSLAYVTDTEHVPGRPDENVLKLMRDVDLAIYDCTYTDDEFPSKIGWGHSTWQEGIRLARMAGVRRLAIFHHDPEHDDAFMEHVEELARREWEGALVARDNMELTLD